MNSKRQRRLAAALTLAVAATLLSACAGNQATVSEDGTPADAQTQGGAYTIALSNSYLGNSWRQTMVKVFEETAEQAKKDGLIAEYSVSNTSQNTATEQIAQIKSLILKHPDAILVDSASPTALNSVIEDACDAGIKVVVFDSLASADCEYDVVNGLKEVGYLEAKMVADAMGGSGNLLMVRGIVGSQPENEVYSGQLEALGEYPDIEVVKEVVGQASDSVAQEAVQEVLPSLPQIDGVLTAGATNGVLKALEAAGKPLPAAVFDNTGEGLRYWQELASSQEYKGGSVRNDPGQAAAAIWVALALLNGQDVPKTTTLPNVVISQDELAEWIDVTPAGSVAAWPWTREQTEQAVTASKDGNTVDPLPVPTAAP
ncbi:MAG: substrate-binding domain-containing protein [Bifidobacteriaceae bacterium]|jgi:ribose transport system substrate-binding protein|nr:substrate-binding domain-containing protein [Bifidobacteriaceae bacterium]